jgi:hypothetical protein
VIIERAQEIADKIAAEGVRATWDSREAANPPVVLVAPPTITPDNRCVATFVWPIYALAPQPSDADVLTILDGLITAIRAAGFDGPMRPVTYPSAAGVLAAYELDYSETS